MARNNRNPENNPANVTLVMKDGKGRFTSDFKAHVVALYTAGNGAGTCAKILQAQGYNVAKSGVMSIITSTGVKDGNRADKANNPHIGNIEREIADTLIGILTHNESASAENKLVLSPDDIAAQFPHIHSAAFSIYYNRALGIARSEMKALKELSAQPDDSI